MTEEYSDRIAADTVTTICRSLHLVLQLRSALSCSGARDVGRSLATEGNAGGWELVFHKGQSQVSKPQAAAICAGVPWQLLQQCK